MKRSQVALPALVLAATTAIATFNGVNGQAATEAQANMAAPLRAAVSADGGTGSVTPRASRSAHRPTALTHREPERSRPARGDARLPHGLLDRVDLGPGDAQAGAGVLDRPSISADGRYVAFASFADNLVADRPDHKGLRSDVYVRDRLTRRTILVSATPDGKAANNSSSAPAISADGRWIAFESYADDLAFGARRGIVNIYLRDLVTGRTRLVSGARGQGGAADSGEPSIDAHGEHVAFGSLADDLVGEPDDGRNDVFVWDRASGAVRRVGPAAVDGTPTHSSRPSLSADGRHLAFVVTGTRGGDCVDAYAKDLATGALSLLSVATDSAGGCGRVSDVAMSGDGRHVGFSTTWPLSPADPDFTHDVYVRDLDARTTTMVSAPRTAGERGPSYAPSLSQDGRWVAFSSYAHDLGAGFVRGTNSAYLTDLRTGTVAMIAHRPGRRLPHGSSYAPVITADGAHLAFASSAQYLVPSANNHVEDVYVLDRSGARYPAARTPVTAPVVPPRTWIDVGPVGTVKAGEVQRFVLQADIAPVRFQCRFDEGRWHWCPAEVTWKVRPGDHRFLARAVDSAGNVDPVQASRVFRAR